jgi:putative transposase
MPRRPRVHLDGVPLHILQRGHDRQACFLAEADYHTYLQCLREAASELECRVHAFALMSNHVHLLLTPKKAEAVPRLIIALGRRYVQYFNQTYGRSGPLWDSRYKSSLIHAESCLLACQRYIELNPVRAGLVDDPAHYRWSSYRHHASNESAGWLVPHAVYLALGGDAKRRQAAYRALFRGGQDADEISAIRLALNQNQPLGNARFLNRIEKLTGERREARPRGRPRSSTA